MGFLSKIFGRRQTVEVVTSPVPIAAPKQPEAPPRPAPGRLLKVDWRDGSFPMEVVGESNYQPALVSICGSHTREGHDGEYEAIIELEPSNRYDPNAVKVMIKGKTVGYLPREQAKRVGGQLDEAGSAAARCRARIRGGWRTNQYDEGDFGVRLGVPMRGPVTFV